MLRGSNSRLGLEWLETLIKPGATARPLASMVCFATDRQVADCRGDAVPANADVRSPETRRCRHRPCHSR